MVWAKEQKRKYQNEWYKKRREKYLKEMGPCIFCGSTENLTLHHKDPSQKITHRIWSWSNKRIREELEKCAPACRECHEHYHAEAMRKTLEHGTRNAYDRHGCRCDLCKQVSWYHRKQNYVPR